MPPPRLRRAWRPRPGTRPTADPSSAAAGCAGSRASLPRSRSSPAPRASGSSCRSAPSAPRRDAARDYLRTARRRTTFNEEFLFDVGSVPSSSALVSLGARRGQRSSGCTASSSNHRTLGRRLTWSPGMGDRWLVPPAVPVRHPVPHPPRVVQGVGPGRRHRAPRHGAARREHPLPWIWIGLVRRASRSSSRSPTGSTASVGFGGDTEDVAEQHPRHRTVGLGRPGSRRARRRGRLGALVWTLTQRHTRLTGEATFEMKLFIVRHVKAGDRSRWDGPDHDRPISKTGRRQADALARATRRRERVGADRVAVAAVRPVARAAGRACRAQGRGGRPARRGLVDRGVDGGRPRRRRSGRAVQPRRRDPRPDRRARASWHGAHERAGLAQGHALDPRGHEAGPQGLRRRTPLPDRRPSNPRP